MDIELDLSGPGTPGLATPDGNEDTAAYDREIKSLKTYVDSLPYKCESIPEMHSKLQWIVGRLLVCVKSRDWAGVPTCDGLLHW